MLSRCSLQLDILWPSCHVTYQGYNALNLRSLSGISVFPTNENIYSTRMIPHGLFLFYFVTNFIKVLNSIWHYSKTVCLLDTKLNLEKLLINWLLLFGVGAHQGKHQLIGLICAAACSRHGDINPIMYALVIIDMHSITRLYSYRIPSSDNQPRCQHQSWSWSCSRDSVDK